VNPSRLALCAVALLLGLGALLAAPAPAGAHAVLESSDPADGAALDEPPAEVSFVFNEGVRASLGGIRVVDADGERVDTGAVEAEGGTAVIGLEPDLPDGTYTAAFRVISADGHPIRGGIVFTVGEATQATTSVSIEDVLGGSDQGFEIAAAVLRAIAYLGTFLAAGGALFLLVVHDGGPGRDRLVRLVTIGAGVGAVAAVLEIPVQAALATGLGLTAVTESGVLGDVVADGVGLSTALVVAGLAAVAAAVQGWGVRPTGTAGRVVALGGALVATGAFALSGHTRTTDPTWLVIPTDAVHGIAGAAWFGGLVLLFLTLRQRARDEDPEAAAGVLERFSRLAAFVVVIAGVAGSVLAWAEVRELPGLATTYGVLLLAKVAVLAVVVMVACWNRWQLVPRVAAKVTDDDRSGALTTVRQTVRLEAIGLVAVLAITAVLVNVTPASTAAGIDGLFSETKPFGEDYELNLVVDPGRVGQNEVHLYIYDDTGAPLTDDPFDSMLLRLIPPGEGLGAIEREPQYILPGHYTLAGNELSIPGTWNLEAEAREGEFGLLTADFDVRVSR
jgi:copper transport protein